MCKFITPRKWNLLPRKINWSINDQCHYCNHHCTRRAFAAVHNLVGDQDRLIHNLLHCLHRSIPNHWHQNCSGRLDRRLCQDLLEVDRTKSSLQERGIELIKLLVECSCRSSRLGSHSDRDPGAAVAACCAYSAYAAHSTHVVSQLLLHPEEA